MAKKSVVLRFLMQARSLYVVCGKIVAMHVTLKAEVTKNYT